MDRRFAIVSQIFMTFMVALSMSGVMSLIALGPGAAWLALWPKQFLVAWPIAFLLTMIAWPAAVRLTRMVLRP